MAVVVLVTVVGVEVVVNRMKSKILPTQCKVMRHQKKCTSVATYKGMCTYTETSSKKEINGKEKRKEKRLNSIFDI